MTEEQRWADEELRDVQLGHSRRSERVARMLARGAERPAGRITQVMLDPAEQQGAYDLLEGGRVSPRALVDSFARATVRRGREARWMFTVVDGSSISVTDLKDKPGIGSIGNLKHGARGLKVITALGVDPGGVTLGLMGQTWWARTGAQPHSADKRKRSSQRSWKEKETRHWVDAIEQAKTAADREGVRLWFLLDREADNQDLLRVVSESGHEWTVRGAWDRLTETTGEDEQRVRARLASEAHVGVYELAVAAGPKRKARTANMVVRAARVTLLLRQRGRDAAERLAVNVVWTREEGTAPAGEKPIDWLLLTNHRIDTFEHACEVVVGYTRRWRIEEFHKTWKSGGCHVEDSQLRSGHALEVWATMLAAVAARAERLRLLSRQPEDRLAGQELSAVEVRALILLKRRHRKRTEVITDVMPTLRQATLWIAELGGYTGKSSGGPPGAITIRRGLERLGPAAEMLAIVEEGGLST